MPIRRAEHTPRPFQSLHRPNYRSGAAILIYALLSLVLTTGDSIAQLPIPADGAATYLDDSTRAAETLAQLDDLTRVGSLAEAARTLQSLLDTEGDRVLQSPDDPELFLPVRGAIHNALLSRPELLSVYARQELAAAEAALEAGNHATVERNRFLTDAGYEAALRVAQQHLEAARFDAAWLTLSQLEAHPRQQAPDHAADAARLAASIARYQKALLLPTQTEVPAALAAARWARVAGIDLPAISQAAVPVDLDKGDRPAIATTPPNGPPPRLDGIVPTPLAAADLPIAAPWAGQSTRAAPSRRLNWALPAILDSLTIINDGDAVTAYDRFTLRERWQYPSGRVVPVERNGNDADRSRGRTRLIEDPATVTAYRDLIIAAMGNVINGRREGESTVVALDRATGRPRWRIRPDQLSPELATCSVRGPVVVQGDTALIMLRRNERSRRTISTSIAAIDLADGSLRWHRFLASVGALPYQQQTRSPQSITVVESVAYLTDEIGILAAVDAQTGSPVWIRRLTPLTTDGNQTKPWALHAPVPMPGGRLAAISPDRTTLLAIDRRTGEIAATRSTGLQSTPAYLLPLGNALALIDPNGFTLVDNTNINRSVTRRTELPPARAPAVGRAVAARGRLYVPVETGIIRFKMPSGESGFIPLDHAGNIDIAEGQLLAADDTRLRTYLAWDTAADILRARADAEPGNPEHAVSFAELAHRAGQADEIVPAVDRAISTIRGATPGEGTSTVSRRLFDSILDMVTAAQDERDARPGGTPRATRQVLSAQNTTDLITRLDRLADSPTQRVAHLLAMGRQLEQTGRPSEAVETYQRVLTDEVLATTPWRGRRLNIRSEIEATRRLTSVVATNGPAVYDAFTALAQSEFIEQTASMPSPDALDRLARRYPLAPASIRARIAQAAALDGQDLDRDALIAGNASIDAVRRLSAAGIPVADTLSGEAFGIHIAALADSNRIEEAAALLAEFTENSPDIPLRNQAGPIDPDSLFDTITRRLAARRTGPRLGPEVLPEDEPQLIQGYALRPLARPEPRGVARARYDGVLIVAKQGGTIAWHAPAADGSLAPGWTREIDRDPILLRTDEVSAWIFWPDQTGGWLERTDLADGKPMWTSRAWADLIESTDRPGDPDAINDRFLDPIAGRVRGAELLVATGARTLIFIERAGRAVALDAATGRELWARPLPVTEVHDADLAAGVLAVVGSGPDAKGTLGPTLAILDPRSGEIINTDDRLPTPPRWVRVTEAGDVLTGLKGRILSVSPFDPGLNWEINDQPLFETREAWLNGTRLLIRADDDALWQIDTTSGQLADAPLETRGRIDTTDRIVVRRTPTRLILAAADGVCVFDNNGALAGIDAFSQPARLLPAVVAENTLAVLKIERGRFGIGGTRFAVNLLTHQSARVTHDAVVRLFGDPTDMQAIDGRLLIAAGDLTAVIRIPLEDTESGPDKPHNLVP